MTTFGILGPLQIAGAPAPGGPKQRALLALLLVHANEPVSRDAIVEELWPNGRPTTAQHAVQVYVSRLRKALAERRAEIRTEGGGYRLAVEPSSVDAYLFEQRFAESRAALANGDAAAADATLTAALELWRGPALLDVRFESFAQGEIGRLDELRLAAIESRVEARLRLGRHLELVPELDALVEAEPLRERLRAQLMLALYRSGRQAQALEVYRDAARVLRDELGLEPTAELRRLETAVLNQDPELAGDGAAVASLPIPATPLVGREREVDELLALVRGSARLVTLTGPGGIGKTRLALETAGRLGGDFPGGVHFVGLASVAEPALVLPTVGHELELPDVDADPLTGIVRRLRERRVLLVLDNFEHVAGAAPSVAALLAACAGLAVMATSRTPLRLSGEQEYDVPPLDEASALQLFARRAQAVRRDFQLTAASEPAVAELCERLDRLPLAIELAAARSRSLAPEEMLESLSRLELAAAGSRDLPRRQRTLRAAIAWSETLLSAPEGDVFRRLGVFADGFDREAAAAVAGAGIDDLELLAEQSLVRRDSGERRFWMLATIREYALERLDAAGAMEATRQAHAEHFLVLAETADRELREGGDQSRWLDVLEREHDNIRAALAWAAADPPVTLRLAGALAAFWAVRGHVREGRGRLEAALGHPGADRGAEARAAVGAGILAGRQADLDGARSLLERAVELYREPPDWPGLVRALTNLGFVELLAGKRATATARYEEALEAARCSTSPRDRVLVTNCLADLAVRDGDYARAERLCAEALPLAREARDQESVAVALLNHAYAAHGAGRPEDAMRLTKESLEDWAAIGDVGGIAWCLNAIALLGAETEPETAALLVGMADRLLEGADVVLDSIESDVRAGAEAAARAAAGDARFAGAHARGRSSDIELVLAAAAGLEVARADPASARSS